MLPLPLDRMGWRLVNQTGGPVSPTDRVGRPTMAFLGFPWCPDVRPLTLSDISGWLDGLGTEADRLTVAPISVDPDRDAPEVLAEDPTHFERPTSTASSGSAPRR